MELAVGLRLGDRYQLTERLAVGGMGDVWRARDEVLGRDVAVKSLRPEYADDPDFLRRFRDEARNTARLSHPGIAAVHDYAEVDGVAFLVMELVEGAPLSALLARVGRLDTDRTLQVVAQTAAALQAAHDAGVIHRDVKPGNLLICPDGTVKVTDFGISRAVSASGLTRTGTVLGTAYYLSPEQSRGEPATPATDVYALGVVAYEALTGQRPFTGGDPLRLARAHQNDVPPPLPADVPPEVSRLVFGAMAKDAARRPASAAELGAAAEALRTGLSPVTPEPATAATALLPVVADPPDRVAWSGDAYPDQRHVRRAMLTIAAVVVLVGLIALVAIAAGGDETAARPTASATTTPTRAPVTVTAAGLLGRPADAVVAELRASGLVPRRVTAESDEPAGTVIGIRPVGAVATGSAVTVVVATPPPDNSDDKGRGKGKGKHE